MWAPSVYNPEIHLSSGLWRFAMLRFCIRKYRVSVKPGHMHHLVGTKKKTMERKIHQVSFRIVCNMANLITQVLTHFLQYFSKCTGNVCEVAAFPLTAMFHDSDLRVISNFPVWISSVKLYSSDKITSYTPIDTEAGGSFESEFRRQNCSDFFSHLLIS